MDFRERLKRQITPEWALRSGEANPPSFFCVGAMKCGTTSLHDYLALHPEMTLPVEKETDFFVRHLTDLTIDAYEAKFEVGKVGAECCPQYLYYPREMKILYPKATVLILVRDPVERFISHWRHVVHKGRTTAKKVSALINAGDFDALMEINRLPFLYSRYADPIRSFRAFFRPHVMSFHDMVERPEEFYRKVCDLIGVSYVAELPFPHSHASTDRPKITITKTGQAHLRAYFDETNSFILNEFGIDLFR